MPEQGTEDTPRMMFVRGTNSSAIKPMRSNALRLKLAQLVKLLPSNTPCLRGQADVSLVGGSQKHLFEVIPNLFRNLIYNILILLILSPIDRR